MKVLSRAYTTSLAAKPPRKKRPGRTATRPPSSLAKGTSLVKEHCGPPRERIPEVVEAILVMLDWPDRLRRQAVVGCGVGGCGVGGGGAGGFAGSVDDFAFGRTGARSNSTSFSDLSP
jgi:hypothetical protein